MGGALPRVWCGQLSCVNRKLHELHGLHGAVCRRYDEQRGSGIVEWCRDAAWNGPDLSPVTSIRPSPMPLVASLARCTTAQGKKEHPARAMSLEYEQHGTGKPVKLVALLVVSPHPFCLISQACARCRLSRETRLSRLGGRKTYEKLRECQEHSRVAKSNCLLRRTHADSSHPFGKGQGAAGKRQIASRTQKCINKS